MARSDLALSSLAGKCGKMAVSGRPHEFWRCACHSQPFLVRSFGIHCRCCSMPAADATTAGCPSYRTLFAERRAAPLPQARRESTAL